MKARTWLIGGFAAGGLAIAIAHSPQTHNQPLFQPEVTGVPAPTGGPIQAPSQNLGVPDSEIPPAASQTATSSAPPVLPTVSSGSTSTSTSSTTAIPTTNPNTSSKAAYKYLAMSNPPSSGFGACWWKYYHGYRSTPC